MKSEVIIVGNGTSLVEGFKGEQIDNHGTICRFNNCRLRGFEGHTGTKTHVWFTCLHHVPRQVQELNPEAIVVHSWEPDAGKCKTFATYPKALHASKLDHCIIPEMSEFAKSDYKVWSTGALAIWRMLKTVPHVTITGFDWWERAKHHYADNEVRGTTHQPEIEKRFIDLLVAEGRVQFL